VKDLTQLQTGSVSSGVNRLRTRKYVINNKRNHHSHEDLSHPHLTSVSRIRDTADSSISRRGFLGLAAASIFLVHGDDFCPLN
jgi:hypothetical protein